jgi:FtsP/CotA-like multicopper oxidase with cupredoxin domain
VAVGTALALTGCAAGQISQTADQVSGIDGGNGRVGHIGVLNALLATPQGSEYPKGSSAPLQLWVSNDGLTNATLTKITTPAASSVSITGSATVPGQSLRKFTGDPVKITLTGLTRSITYGQSIPLTFQFDSGSVTINVPVDTPDERTTGRPEINIQPSEGASLWESGSGQPEGQNDGGATKEAVATTSGG